MTGNLAPALEREWIQQAQHGDREAFTCLVDHYWERLYRWLFHLSHDRHLAEDLAQESFLKAFAALASFDGSHFQAWLFRIGHHAWSNGQRGKRRLRQALPDDLAAHDEGPAELAMNREALVELTRAVGRLPADFRAAFLLRAQEDLSFKEIAGILDISEETARWRVFKARQKLLEVMEDHL